MYAYFRTLHRIFVYLEHVSPVAHGLLSLSSSLCSNVLLLNEAFAANPI